MWYIQHMITKQPLQIDKQKIAGLVTSNQLPLAIEYCTALLAQWPDTAEIYNILGVLNAQGKDLTASINWLKQAIQLNPIDAIYHNNLSCAYKQQGNMPDALAHAQQALRLAPNYAEAYNNLGSLYYSQGRIDDAIAACKKAIRLEPNYLEPHYNLANSLIKQDKVQEAIGHYETVLKLQPRHASAKQNLAMAYLANKQLTKAKPLLEQAVADNPFHPELHAELAQIYLEIGDSAAAIAMYCKALKLSSQHHADWQHNLAILYLREQQPQQALLHFTNALAADPTNQTAMHMVQALSNANPANANAKYVSDLFDQYAEFYNQHVTEKLEYKVPQLLRQIVSKHLQHNTKALNILDVGCGTGLCSIYFRDLAAKMVGIDLSIAMLQQAHTLKAYDALCCGNVLQAIPGSNTNFFDLVIAADVLVYCGELAEIFANCRKALTNAGLFAFSVEKLTTGSYQLQTSGRFAHEGRYITELSAQYNFVVIDCKEIILRQSQAQPVSGIIYLLQACN